MNRAFKTELHRGIELGEPAHFTAKWNMQHESVISPQVQEDDWSCSDLAKHKPFQAFHTSVAMLPVIPK